MKKPNPQNHQACRSLLQKAVRRGDIVLIQKIARHLYEAGDIDWLKARTAIITFEECWPLGSNLHQVVDFSSILDALLHVAQTVKVKDATGLGVMGYALSEGDTSVLKGDSEDEHIKNICIAIKDKNFWHQIEERCVENEQQQLVRAATKAYRHGGWPWDRALIQAAAYLTVTDGVPKTWSTNQKIEVPFWVGLDKHTPQGKKAFQEVAKAVSISSSQLSWISFYLESALVNEDSDSYWWLRERQWRLKKFGLSQEKAFTIWEKVRPSLIIALREREESLKIHLLEEHVDLGMFVKDSTNLINQQQRLLGF